MPSDEDDTAICFVHKKLFNFSTKLSTTKLLEKQSFIT